MSGAVRLLGAIALALLLGGSLALAAPSSVATKLQLHGHLPDLGETPALWVFATAPAYDAFRVRQGVADVLPPSGSLYLSFDRELLALYTRGNDSGGRCLRAGSVSSVSGATVTLDLSWDPSLCGAPASAHYPFVLVSLARAADDGSAWTDGRQVCASAPGVDGSRACAPASGAAASPSTPPSASASAAPSPAASPTSTPAPTASPTPTAAPTASPTAARSSSPSPSLTAVVAGSSGPGGGFLDLAVWLAAGLIIGAFVTALLMRRPRVYRV